MRASAVNPQKVFDLAITFLVWSFVSLPLHEYGHWVGGQIVGIPLTIEYKGIAGHAVSANGEYNLFCYLSGGLIAGAAFALLWWRARASPTEWDLDDELVLGMMGTGQLGMAVAEGGSYLWGWPLMTSETIGASILGLAMLSYYLKRVANWLTI